jgi:hypothetical protein
MKQQRIAMANREDISFAPKTSPVLLAKKLLF